ncbi:chaps-domain-containing protein [Microstroma glucosiphilum]|uniref:Chaps-domain-containing protein n=1 Tax=Pseudomicrostroma glucosiphilum TaxID=1684307 RepID=A0A316UDC7_9BASI|nr:chaps-domain-containing protein [Pseudomicrostroma glucosiphilum]PWN22373.1 chaps-domain-containing protein [Pseudomicrostroma glucosiphilum]
MGDAFVAQPEFFEADLGESLNSRTESLASFRELGPPDLCHVIKTTGRTGSKDIGSYHYVSGVDASSSAALAAYINSLTYELEQNPAWFSGKTSYKLKSGVYCCFNAFSRVDVRVEVRIPGSVDAFVVDLRGDRHPPTPEIWQEVYLSALLRSILYADDANFRLAGYRKLDPIAGPEAEHRFLRAAENLFFKGWQLGSEPEIQVATVVSNHLANGVLKYFGDAGRYEQAVNLFEKLYAREPVVAALVAQAYLGMNEEIKAVQIMHAAIKETPHSYALLHVQADFLKSKGKADWALQLSKQAVNCAPSEFVTWAKLTECYINVGDWESALFTLNSCPMFTYNERDLHRMPPPAKTHLPTKQFIADSGLLDEESAKDNEADVALLRLPAPALRGTFAKAYALLSRLVSRIGWDELLRCRSAVFVMEEEYRNQRPGEATSSSTTAAGSTVSKSAAENDDNASVKAIPPTPGSDDGIGDETFDSSGDKSLQDGMSKLGLDAGANSSSHSIPTIKISTESDHERERAKIADYVQGAEGGKTAGEEETGGGAVEVTPPPLEKPAQAQAGAQHGRTDSVATVQGASTGADTEQQQAQHADPSTRDEQPASGFSFTNKRLCERWLDNLFMVLYEDLRVYTIWRAELAHYKTQGLPYRKTGTEWEILGELALRLHHKEEAKDAFQRCIEAKFSAKGYLRLLESYVEARDVQRSLWMSLRLTAYNHRWYTEGSYPGAVATNLFKLIRTEGLAKVSYTLVSMSPPNSILKLMQNHFAYAQTFKIPGHDT